MNLMDLMVQITAKDGASAVIRGVGETAQSVAQSISSAFSGIGDDLTKSFAGIGETLDGLAQKANAIASTITKAGGIITGAAVAGVGGLAKNAVESYADYEQLVGGVETLFGAGGRSLEEYAAWVGKSVDEVRDEYKSLTSAQGKLFANADKAYKSAGLSANDYMETATSFAASLVSSLGGDTVAAADMVETAITDMADNANKMGTAISSIRDAYRGFSKQNYTMLDNLKLGYGGTTGEMARLLNDANAIDSSILGEGVELDTEGRNLLDGVGLDQIIRAINTIQKEMDITGTTAEEADSTIQGSVASMQSAWQNMLTGIADEDADFSGLIENLVTSTETALGNLTPRIQQSLSGVGDLITAIAPQIMDAVPGILESTLPGLLESVTSIIGSLGENIGPVMETVITSVADSMSNITGIDFSGLLQAFTGMFDGVDFSFITQPIQNAFASIDLSGIVSGLTASMQSIDLSSIVQPIQEAFQSITQIFQDSDTSPLTEFFTSILEPLGQIKEGLTPMVDGIKSLFAAIQEAAPSVITEIASGLGQFFSSFTESIASAVTSISEGVGAFLGYLSGFAPGVLTTIAAGVKTFLGAFSAAAGAIIEAIATALGFIVQHLNVIGPLLIGVAAALATFKAAMLITTVIENFSKTLRILQTATEAQTLAQTLLNAAVNANPFALLATLVLGVVAAVVTFIATNEEAAAKIGEIWQTILDAISTFIGNIKSTLHAFVEWCQSTIQGIISWFSQVKAQIKAFFDDPLGTIGDVAAGIGEGISDAASKVAGGIKGLFKGAEEESRDAIDAHSPSRVYKKLGGYMVEGLVEGWKESAHLMTDAMEKSYDEWGKIATPTMSVAMEDSTIGKVSHANHLTAVRSASANPNMYDSYSVGTGRVIALNVDGKELARTIYDPMLAVNGQLGGNAYTKVVAR